MSRIFTVKLESSIRQTTDRLIQNGVGAFILPCKRMDFHYCDWAGSSRGMV